MKDDSFYDKTSCKGVRLEGMSLSFFTSDTIQRKMTGVGGLNGCDLDRFMLERVGNDEKAQVYLNFVLYTKCSEEIILWYYRQQGASVFVEFDTTQAMFAYEGEDDEKKNDDAQPKLPLATKEAEPGLMNAPKGYDPNDEPNAVLPNDKRSVTLPSSKPSLVKKGSKKQ